MVRYEFKDKKQYNILCVDPRSKNSTYKNIKEGLIKKFGFAGREDDDFIIKNPSKFNVISVPDYKKALESIDKASDIDGMIVYAPHGKDGIDLMLFKDEADLRIGCYFGKELPSAFIMRSEDNYDALCGNMLGEDSLVYRTDFPYKSLPHMLNALEGKMKYTKL